MKDTIQSGTNILTDNWSLQVIADFLSLKCDPSMDWGWIGTNNTNAYSGTIKSGAFQIDCLISLLEQILFSNKIYVMKEWISIWHGHGTDLDLLYSEDKTGIIDYIPTANVDISKEQQIWTKEILTNKMVEEKFSIGMEKYNNGENDFWSQVLNGITEYLAFSSINNLTYSPHPARSGYLKSTIWEISNDNSFPTSGINKFNQIINTRRVSLGKRIGHDDILTKLNTQIPSAAMLCIADSSPTFSPIAVAIQMRNNDEIKNLRQILHNLTLAIGRTEVGITEAIHEVNFYITAFDEAVINAENILKIPTSLGGQNKPGYVDMEYFNYEKHIGKNVLKSTDISTHTGILTRLISTGTNNTRKILESKLKIKSPQVYKDLFHWHNNDFFTQVEKKQNINLYKIKMEETNYINNGNAGIVGLNGKIINSNVEQTNQINEENKNKSEILTEELTKLLLKLKEDAIMPEQFSDCAIVAEAKEVAKSGDENKAFEILKKSGKWVFDTATQIGIRLTAAFIKETMIK